MNGAVMTTSKRVERLFDSIIERSIGCNTQSLACSRDLDHDRHFTTRV